MGHKSPPPTACPALLACEAGRQSLRKAPPAPTPDEEERHEEEEEEERPRRRERQQGEETKEEEYACKQERQEGQEEIPRKDEKETRKTAPEQTPQRDPTGASAPAGDALPAALCAVGLEALESREAGLPSTTRRFPNSSGCPEVPEDARFMPRLAIRRRAPRRARAGRGLARAPLGVGASAAEMA